MRFRWEFDLVKKTGTVFPGRYMLLSACCPDGESSRRIGFITGKRLGKAVLRNLVRRRLRETYRLQRRSIKPCLWLVLIARPTAVKASFHDLKAEFTALLQSAQKTICA
ncbi:MAG: ribonuclease P protein component [candidate division Zixibacteria bacterium]|nr:ribonuclease P protein component [candidate division Zixibacteria bacterium]